MRSPRNLSETREILMHLQLWLNLSLKKEFRSFRKIGIVLAILLLIYVYIFINFAPHSLPDAYQEEIIKPITDRREYNSYMLQNRMKVLAVSDESATTSAIALSVRVGSSQEPRTIPGLAHYLEHVMFLKSKKYPELNALQKFVENSGGLVNAFTAPEETNYHLQIPEREFDKALDIFMNMFSDPVFDKEKIESEVGAVEAEYTMNLNKDLWRFDFMTKVAANPQSVYSRFTVGNRNSLLEQPKKTHSGVIKTLESFYKDEYQPELMTLVVIHNEPLDQVAQKIEASFGTLQSKGESSVGYGYIKPYAGSYGNKLIQFLPVGQSRKLYLVFCVESSLEYPVVNPLNYLYVLLQYEGLGSLTSLLKKEGWILDLEAKPHARNSLFELPSIQMTLTQKGLQEIPEILEATFAYINLIKEKGTSRELFDQFSMITKYIFNYTQYEEEGMTRNLIDEAMILASDLHHFPSVYLLGGDQLLHDYNEDLMKEFLNSINVDNLMVFVADPNFKVAKREEKKVDNEKKKPTENDDDDGKIKQTTLVSENSQDQPPKETNKPNEPESNTGTTPTSEPPQEKQQEGTNQSSEPESNTGTTPAPEPPQEKQQEGANQSSEPESNTGTTPASESPQEQQQPRETNQPNDPETSTGDGEKTTSAPVDDVTPNVPSIQDKSQEATNARILLDKVPSKILKFKELDKYEPLYHLNYSISALPADLLDSLRNGPFEKFKGELHPPEKNKYIPTNFKFAGGDECKDAKCIRKFAEDRQNTVTEIEEYETYYLLERSFGVPLTSCHIRLTSAELENDIDSVAISGVLGELVKANIASDLYEIIYAGNSVVLEPRDIKIEAFSDVFPKIMNKILQEYKKSSTPSKFEEAKLKYIATLEDKMIEKPYQAAVEVLNRLLVEDRFTQEELWHSARELTWEKFEDALKDQLNSYHVETFLYGNVLFDDAKAYAKKVAETFGYVPVKSHQKDHKRKVLEIHGQNVIYRTTTPMIKGKNVLVLNYYQGGFVEPRDWAILQMLVRILEPEAFAYLRTQKELGYVVKMADSLIGNVMGVRVLVMSSSWSVNEVDAEIEQFFKNTRTYLDNLSQEKFSQNVKSFGESLKYGNKDFRLKEKDLYSQIVNQNYLWNLREEVQSELPKITKTDLIECFEHLFVTSPNKLSVQLISEDLKEFPKEVVPESKQVSKTNPTLLTKQEDLISFISKKQSASN